RHMTSDRDWSSDVCSSDLGNRHSLLRLRKKRTLLCPWRQGPFLVPGCEHGNVSRSFRRCQMTASKKTKRGGLMSASCLYCEQARSEERRVGQEARSDRARH